MPSILLVRHAQASYGGADYDLLSGLAVEQCKALRADLVARRLDRSRLVVVSGPARRHRATAARVLPGVRVAVDAGWEEYSAEEVLARHGGPGSAGASLSAGERTMSSRAFQEVLDPALARWVADPASTWPPFSRRTGGALERLASELRRGEVGVVFTSAGAIASVAAAALGTTAVFVALNRVQVNTGVTKLVVGRSGTTLVSFNDHAHLEGGGQSLISYR